MKTHAPNANRRVPSRPPLVPAGNALTHQVQLRQALRRAGVQPRLQVDAADELLEREADAASERVLRMPEPAANPLPNPLPSAAPRPAAPVAPRLQRQPALEEEQEAEQEQQQAAQTSEPRLPTPFFSSPSPAFSLTAPGTTQPWLAPGATTGGPAQPSLSWKPPTGLLPPYAFQLGVEEQWNLSLSAGLTSAALQFSNTRLLAALQYTYGGNAELSLKAPAGGVAFAINPHTGVFSVNLQQILLDNKLRLSESLNSKGTFAATLSYSLWAPPTNTSALFQPAPGHRPIPTPSYREGQFWKHEEQLKRGAEVIHGLSPFLLSPGKAFNYLSSSPEAAEVDSPDTPEDMPKDMPKDTTEQQKQSNFSRLGDFGQALGVMGSKPPPVDLRVGVRVEATPGQGACLFLSIEARF